MPTYSIRYTRLDMPKGYIGRALKTAHTKEEALKHLCTGSEKKGWRLNKSGVPITDLTIEETI